MPQSSTNQSLPQTSANFFHYPVICNMSLPSLRQISPKYGSFPPLTQINKAVMDGNAVDNPGHPLWQRRFTPALPPIQIPDQSIVRQRVRKQIMLMSDLSYHHFNSIGMVTFLTLCNNFLFVGLVDISNKLCSVPIFVWI
eukprot:TRINITY_DN14297_c0_g1_i1.p1 TRINITY_DN14297_c0_g1~~TRINITY_DN14297_c0_g1_i1.p1  ORF type:complete len:140 (+),score=4.17 TRINITY_DN14297_c0_g1_i1:1008-1427(+)